LQTGQQADQLHLLLLIKKQVVVKKPLKKKKRKPKKKTRMKAKIWASVYSIKFDQLLTHITSLSSISYFCTTNVCVSIVYDLKIT